MSGLIHYDHLINAEIISALSINSFKNLKQGLQILSETCALLQLHDVISSHKRLTG